LTIRALVAKRNVMIKAAKSRVLITLRPDILDVQGQTIQASLQALGFQNIQSVRVGKLIEIETDQDVEAMARELLVNPIIEDFKVEVL
jgi:phosphoribosylformylglycinamidine synthase PurS subunit